MFVFIIAAGPSRFTTSLGHVKVDCGVKCTITVTLHCVPSIRSSFRGVGGTRRTHKVRVSKGTGLVDHVGDATSVVFPLVFADVNHVSAVDGTVRLHKCKGCGGHA